MDEELRRKIKEARLLYEKYVQMMDECMDEKKPVNEDFNRRIMKVYHCMTNAYDEINNEIGLRYDK
ncbi:hypothetical protein SCCGRSA3_00241 [Marine Group I thaumarchaeote SCGC RSA3]|uniref:Uncharacterized protein n=2 Tax=Marine Group I TaxID=905826 RepID=A0A081RQH4_9ARCH|nr:hypothetical protein AAA799N04_00139 [Marine Group I thaumarchaeote SCGC AAA799-N04]KFM20427.1 hypothetical protein SCCGRSA3_00241 [Marine Group I thaumarchaeote SCGC RSA3]